MRGATRCYIGASTSWAVTVPYRGVAMTDPHPFDDPWPQASVPPSRLRRVLRIAVVLLLIASMTFLAWVSGRGELRVTPEVPPTTTPISAEVFAP